MFDVFDVCDTVLGVGQIEDFLFFLIVGILSDSPSEFAVFHDVDGLSSESKGHIDVWSTGVELFE